MAIFFTSGESGLTVYAFIRKSTDGTIWNGTTFESYSAANWGNYDVAMTEQTSSGFYSGTFPAGITDDDFYHITTYYQSGGSPAAGDTVIGQDSYKFDGTNLYNGVSLTAQMKTDVLTQIENAFNAAIPASPTANSIYERIKAIDDRLPTGYISGFDPSVTSVNLNPSQTGVTIGTVNTLGSTATTQINAEVVDVLFTDLISELTVGAPSATPTIAKALMALYMTWRNQTTQSTSELKVRNNAGSVIFKATTTDSGTEFTKAQYQTGP